VRPTLIRRRGARGLTYFELMYTAAVIMVLTAVAVPTVRLAAKRHREVELRRNLESIRRAIDAYHKDAMNGDINLQFVGADLHPIAKFYPPSLQTLVDGVPLTLDPTHNKIYLRRIPHDPFNPDGFGADEETWRLRAYQDELDDSTWGGRNVYDIRSAVEYTALDETKYSEW
jgi:general secretion pathway protein G